MSSNNHVPSLFKEGAEKTAKILPGMENVLIAAHINPDGDALGSMSACGYIFKKLGINFALYSPTPIAKYLTFLPLPGPIYNNLASLPFEPRNAVYLDCSEAHRLGYELAEHCHRWPAVNIDHHICEHGLGTLDNYIMSQAAATSQLVAYTAIMMNLELSGQLGESIALGLMTDTGGFCHGNTTADVFSLCALLVQSGCNITWLREQLQNSWSLAKLRLWGKILSSLKLHNHGRIAISAVSIEELKSHDCTAEDLEGLVEWFRKIRGVDVAGILREEDGGKCKFSLRSYGEIDVRAMAAQLGGGGHYNAAGGIVHLPLKDAEPRLIQVVDDWLEDNTGD